jgi:biopolymer transport protein ExbD
MRFGREKRKAAPSVIIVSLIDVLIVVLIFLMVTTHFKNREASLKLALPESKEARQGSSQDARPFTVLVATNFPYFWVENIPVTLDQLQSRLVSAAQANPKVAVAIKADKNAPFGEVIKVIDAAKVAKVGSINAITEKPATAAR